jgi:hypothetical protein
VPNALTLKERIESRADDYRREAKLLRHRGAEQAATTLETVAEEIEADAHDHTPEWWRLPQVQAVKGWSLAWLRERAREFADRGGPGHPLARKTDGGRWELHLLALEELPKKQTEPEVDLSELEPMDGR